MENNLKESNVDEIEDKLSTPGIEGTNFKNAVEDTPYVPDIPLPPTVLIARDGVTTSAEDVNLMTNKNAESIRAIPFPETDLKSQELESKDPIYVQSSSQLIKYSPEIEYKMTQSEIELLPNDFKFSHLGNYIMENVSFLSQDICQNLTEDKPYPFLNHYNLNEMDVNENVTEGHITNDVIGDSSLHHGIATLAESFHHESPDIGIAEIEITTTNAIKDEPSDQSLADATLAEFFNDIGMDELFEKGTDDDTLLSEIFDHGMAKIGITELLEQALDEVSLTEFIDHDESNVNIAESVHPALATVTPAERDKSIEVGKTKEVELVQLDKPPEFNLFELPVGIDISNADLGNVSFAYCIPEQLSKETELNLNPLILAELKSQKKKLGEVATIKQENHYIFCLVTKQTSDHLPEIETIDECIAELAQKCQSLNVKHLAIPRLDCDKDIQKWKIVRELILTSFEETDVRITVYHNPNKISTNHNAEKEFCNALSKKKIHVRPKNKSSSNTHKPELKRKRKNRKVTSTPSGKKVSGKRPKQPTYKETSDFYSAEDTPESESDSTEEDSGSEAQYKKYTVLPTEERRQSKRIKERKELEELDKISLNIPTATPRNQTARRGRKVRKLN